MRGAHFAFVRFCVCSFQRNFFNDERIRHDVRHEQAERGEEHEHAGEGGGGWRANGTEKAPGEAAADDADTQIWFALASTEWVGITHESVQQFHCERKKRRKRKHKGKEEGGSLEIWKSGKVVNSE